MACRVKTHTRYITQWPNLNKFSTTPFSKQLFYAGFNAMRFWYMQVTARCCHCLPVPMHVGPCSPHSPASALALMHEQFPS